MQAIWMWLARTFASPADLGEIDLGAVAAMLAYGTATLIVVRRYDGIAPPRTADREQYDEAA
jgi:hypothetical protein